MKPPLLEHTRSVWEASAGVMIAVAGVRPVEGREGYWLERQDYPAVKWRLTEAQQPQGEVRLVAVSLNMLQGPTPGEMIQKQVIVFQ